MSIRNHTVFRLIMLAVACMVFILCGISVSASHRVKKHKSLTQLKSGLKSVRASERKAQKRLAALKKREAELETKLDEITEKRTDENLDDEPTATTGFAKVELGKVKYETRFLLKKIETCQLNRKCILAEIDIVSNSDIEPIDPLQQDIQFRRPINGQITSKFGMRLHPIEKTEKPHQGIDLAGEMGDPVKASAGGKVVFAGVQRGYGKIIVLQHSDELSSAYGHLSAINVEPGDLVAQGEKIGEVGMTGNSTGPHLHFEIRVNGEPVDPAKYL